MRDILLQCAGFVAVAAALEQIPVDFTHSLHA